VTELKPEDADENELDTRWPRDSDRLFVEQSWAHDAHIVSDPKERFYRMPMGYMRAADLLIGHAMNDVVDRKNVVYAALFCYRQAVELFLKSLLVEFSTVTDQQKPTHSLALLWDRFAEVVRTRDREEAIGLGAARALVVEMHVADEKSDGFRFPAGAKGVPFSFGDRAVDLANLREVMRGLQNFFECAHLDFEHQDDSWSSAHRRILTTICVLSSARRLTTAGDTYEQTEDTRQARRHEPE
jgi:hypothetical protein